MDSTAATVPRTTSGKVQRARVRSTYLEGQRSW